MNQLATTKTGFLTDTDYAMDGFVEWLNKSYGNKDSSYSFTKGKKYFKIIHDSYNSKSVFGFINGKGHFLKANSWAIPHPTPRGSIFNKDKWKQNTSAYGFNYLNGWDNNFGKR